MHPLAARALIGIKRDESNNYEGGIKEAVFERIIYPISFGAGSICAKDLTRGG